MQLVAFQLVGSVIGGVFVVACLWLHNWWATRRMYRAFDRATAENTRRIEAMLADFRARIDRGEFRGKLRRDAEQWMNDAENELRRN